mmetsp:Transcript_129409/g.347058  ORF Transcript_129409/g.347058 Transcript_129409/m.347058 type:complete len:221 (-) Transcript_129409:124-786(-)
MELQVHPPATPGGGRRGGDSMSRPPPGKNRRRRPAVLRGPPRLGLPDLNSSRATCPARAEQRWSKRRLSGKGDATLVTAAAIETQAISEVMLGIVLQAVPGDGTGCKTGCRTERGSQGERQRLPQGGAGCRVARQVPVGHGGVRQAALVGHRGGLVHCRPSRVAHEQEREERQEHGAEAAAAGRRACDVGWVTVGRGGLQQAAVLHGGGLTAGDAATAGE